MNGELTDKQIGTLLNLVRKEARSLGWGDMYHDANKPKWPARLKQLNSIAETLWAMRVNNNVVEGIPQ